MIKFLKTAHEIVIIGPPSSGKKTICRFLAKKMNLIVINKTNLFENIPVSLKNEFATLKKEVLKFLFFCNYNILIFLLLKIMQVIPNRTLD